jgi:hypothetical protein
MNPPDAANKGFLPGQVEADQPLPFARVSEARDPKLGQS